MMTCSAMFFVSFPKYPKIDGNDEKLTIFSFFFFIYLRSSHSNQLNSKSNDDVLQIIEPEWFVEKSAVKTGIEVGKDQKLVCVGKYPTCIKCPPFLPFVYKTSQL